jgi:hypothetical protein
MPRRKVAVVTVEAMAVDMVAAITAVDMVGVITAVVTVGVITAVVMAAGISAAGVISADPRATVRLSPYTTR